MSVTPAWLDRDEYPFPANYFETPHGKMHYISVGAGDPVVFVHGNPSWSFEARNVIKALSGARHCIAPDHLGFGLSAKPWDYSYLPQAQATNLEALLESLDLERITLVVGDWGGPLGLAYAIRHPDKIKAIVITNTWLWSVRTDLYYQGFSGFVGGPFGRWLIRRFNFFARTIVPMTYGDRSKLTPKIHTHFLKPFEIPAERKGSWVFPKQIIGASAWLESLWNQRQQLAGKVALIAWGMRDIAFRQKELNRWTQAFPTATVMRFENSGHFVPEENPIELAEAILRFG